MRDDNVHLADMLLAAQRFAEHIGAIGRAEFLTNRTVQAAVEREISILGEAANRLSPDFRAAHPEFPIRRLIQLRNFYTHAYERLDAKEVWGTAKRFVPRICALIPPLLPDENEKPE